MGFNDNNRLDLGEFSDVAEIHEIVASANMGIWRIELYDGEEPRMYVDETMKMLLGIRGKERSPEKTYTDWFSNIKPEAVESVLHSVSLMKNGEFDENTYQWIHPTKGVRFVRCGGSAEKNDKGFVLRGYHYDVDEIVRRQQIQDNILKHALEDRKEYLDTLSTLEGIFYSLHVIDLVKDSTFEFNSRDTVRSIVNHEQGATEMMEQVIRSSTIDEYLEEALEFTDLTSIADRMKGKQIISKQLIGKHIGWFLASFITMTMDDEGRPTKVIFTTRSIDEEKKQEEKLIRKSQTDELTGLLNRRAYEEDIYSHNDIPRGEDFVYILLDVNGLKMVNDTKGHLAGDELIIGACQCMKRALGSYGRIYRTGGDEFVAIVFCGDTKIKAVLADFDEAIASWTGELVDSLSISYGFISSKEKPKLSIRQLGAEAEKRMYEAKSAHYRRAGFDRRGQQDAHKALCALYTKILKINITNDTYQIVNMDLTEQTKDKGFSESIFEWLKGFGESGQVHQEDLDEYLRITDAKYMREYFASNKTSLHIFYRRKYDDGFKQVMMEIIPANDYTCDNQSCYLYVKNIDK